MKYTVKAYFCINYKRRKRLIGSLETDNFYEAQDFIWDKCERGCDCELVNNETGSKDWAYAEDFEPLF